MHARELVELAAIVSAHGPVLVRGTRRLSASGVQQYWTESKCRLDRWFRSLGRFAHEPPQGRRRRPQPVAPRPRRPGRDSHQRNAHPRLGDRALRLDRQQGTLEAEPIARSVMIGHLEARHRVLHVAGPRAGRRRGSGRPPEPPAAADRTLDRPVDRLPGRAGQRRANSPSSPTGHATSPATCGLRAAAPAGARPGRWCFPRCGRPFAKGSADDSPNADLNARIATAILSCFPAELFDSTGQFRSLWLLRLVNATERRPRDDRRVALARAGVGPAGRIAGEIGPATDAAVPPVGRRSSTPRRPSHRGASLTSCARGRFRVAFLPDPLLPLVISGLAMS